MDRGGRTVLVPVHRGCRNQQHAEHGDCDRTTVFGPFAGLQADEIAAERNPDCRERTTNHERATICQMSVGMPKRVRAGAYIENCRAWEQERYPDPIDPERHESMDRPEIVPSPGV